MKLGYYEDEMQSGNDPICGHELQIATHFSDEYRNMSELFNTTAMLDDYRAFAVTVSKMVKGMILG